MTVFTFSCGQGTVVQIQVEFVFAFAMFTVRQTNNTKIYTKKRYTDDTIAKYTDNMNLQQCLKILELENIGSFQEAKRAYKDLVRVWHPDRFHGNPRLKQKADEKRL